jgi:hypothetical protein
MYSQGRARRARLLQARLVEPEQRPAEAIELRNVVEARLAPPGEKVAGEPVLAAEVLEAPLHEGGQREE